MSTALIYYIVFDLSLKYTDVTLTALGMSTVGRTLTQGFQLIWNRSQRGVHYTAFKGPFWRSLHVQGVNGTILSERSAILKPLR